MRSLHRQVIGSFVLAAAITVSATAFAQSYPTRDITLIVPFGPGGSTDIISRQYAAQLEKILGGNINVENRPGGSGTIGANMIVDADPDGYTIGLAASEVLAHQPLRHPNLSYQTTDDYQPIAKIGDRPTVLFVRGDAPWKSFDAFLDAARNKPGEIRASVPGIGTLSDLVIKELNRTADVEITTVPFTGGGPEAMLALLGGRVEASSGALAGYLGQVQAGDLRVLAVFHKGSNPLAPEAASVIDAGYDVTLKANFHVFAPKGLPQDVLDKLATASLQVVRSDEFAEFAARNDLVIDAMGPEDAKKELDKLQGTFASLTTTSNEK